MAGASGDGSVDRMGTARPSEGTVSGVLSAHLLWVSQRRGCSESLNPPGFGFPTSYMCL